MRFIKIFLLCLICLHPAASAQELDSKGLTLKKQIAETLERHQKRLQQKGQTLNVEGKITVEKAGSYYAVTLPHLSLLDSDKNKIEIGMIALNAVPGDQDSWKISIALPTPILWLDKENTPQRKLSFGTQNFSGTWSPVLENFSSVEARYTDIQIDEVKRGEKTHIKQMSLNSQLQANSENLWSGPLNIKLAGVKTIKSENTPVFESDALSLSLTLSDFSPASYKTARETIDAYNEHSKPEDMMLMSAGERLALFNLITDLVKSSGNGLTVRTDIQNLRMNIDGVETALKSGQIGLSLKGMQEDRLSVYMQNNLQGFQMKQGTEDVSGLTPQDTSMDISFENVPLEKLLELIRASLSETDNKTARQLAHIQTMLLLPQIFSQAGSAVTIKDTSFKNTLYDAKAAGSLKANDQAAFGMSGDFTLIFAGLDEMIKTMQDNKETVSVKMQENADKMIQRLTLLSALGQETQTADGKAAREYKFELKENGEVLLNGTDFSVLMKND